MDELPREYPGNRTVWEWTAHVVRTRRESLGMTQAEAALEAGISEAVWNNLENARQTSYRGTTVAAVSEALGWDSFEGFMDIQAGHTPAVRADFVPPSRRRTSDAQPKPMGYDDLRSMPADLVERFDLLTARFDRLERLVLDRFEAEDAPVDPPAPPSP